MQKEHIFSTSLSLSPHLSIDIISHNHRCKSQPFLIATHARTTDTEWGLEH